MNAERNFFENMTSQKKKRYIFVKKDIHNSDYFNMALKERIMKAYCRVYKKVEDLPLITNMEDLKVLIGQYCCEIIVDENMIEHFEKIYEMAKGNNIAIVCMNNINEIIQSSYYKRVRVELDYEIILIEVKDSMQRIIFAENTTMLDSNSDNKVEDVVFY